MCLWLLDIAETPYYDLLSAFETDKFLSTGDSGELPGFTFIKKGGHLSFLVTLKLCGMKLSSYAVCGSSFNSVSTFTALSWSVQNP